MKLNSLFHNYEYLVDKVEEAFKRVSLEHGSCINCQLHCSDCCQAVFGLFLIEAAFIQEHFKQLKPEVRMTALARAEKADQELIKLQKLLEEFKDDPKMSNYALAKERIRCPLLDENDECILYSRRPITCRVYGIPTKIQGSPRVCGKSGFKSGEKYPVFDLDNIYKELHLLSQELLTEAKHDDLEKASLLVSVSMAISTPIEDIITGNLNKLDERDEREQD